VPGSTFGIRLGSYQFAENACDDTDGLKCASSQEAADSSQAAWDWKLGQAES